MKILLFLPSDDSITADCARVGRKLYGNGLLLEEGDAIRSELLPRLKCASHDIVVLMCHGDEDGAALYGHDKGRALLSSDFPSIPKTVIFAYACNSANLGFYAADNSLCWAGYDYVITPPPYLDESESVFRTAVARLRDCDSIDKAENLLIDLRRQCDTILSKREFHDAPADVVKFFENFWGRLRIWIPGRPSMVKHPEAFEGPLDALYAASSYPW